MTNLKSLVKFIEPEDSRMRARHFFLEFESSKTVEERIEVFNRHTALKDLQTTSVHKLIGAVRAPYRFKEEIPRYDEVFAEVRKVLQGRYGEARMRAFMVGLTW